MGEPKQEFILPEDPNDTILDQRIDINSVGGSNNYVLYREDEEQSIE